MKKLGFALAVVLSLAPVASTAQSWGGGGRGGGGSFGNATRDFTFTGDFSTARAEIRIQDTGTSLNVIGVGDGFDPTLSFVSLFYDTGSVRRGALACLPTTPNPFSPSQMFVGYWYPVGSAQRYLSASPTSYVPIQKTGAAYTPLTSIGTMSIRYDSTPTLSPLVNQNPGRFFLQSCGNVR